ncbi:pilus assembly protein TadC [Vibrio sp. 10N.286.49.B3]|uniref:type II secretion system F family protein n=1 Tax=Vibrio sp. 10N.286.49.B3 TaxID=1880855 RepID=UPI000C8241BC|nr:type II secretion system F family protein [Vibrio sp. 10N.286.49.B3]PMH41236.1 pilus assembly protein TadC [Vibrio sp. 10N.286.49.B3]
MDDILRWLANINIDKQMLILLMILISVSLFVLILGSLFLSSRSPLRMKLGTLRNKDNFQTNNRSSRLENTLESLSPITAPKSSKERASIKQKLMHAGYYAQSAPSYFYAIKLFTIITGVSLAAIIYFFYPDIAFRQLLIIASIAIGLFLPNIILAQLVSKRQNRMRAAVPDTLDLLVVCTESGLGFNAALRRVGDEIVISHPDFSGELLTVCAKMKAGVEMPIAFDEMIERTGLVEIQGLVGMLSHASRIGGSLSKTLRDYTEDFRDKRNQAVEEIAAKIPTKMIFPLLLFIWPCFFIVAVGPALISLSDAFQ